MTQTGTQMGTPAYMSPEQVKGDKSIDHRSDIYALGVTLFYAMEGRSPYDTDNESQFDIFNKIVFEELPVLTENSAQTFLIQKACQKDRNLRFQQIEEFENALNGEAESQPKVVLKTTVKRAASISKHNGAATAALVQGIIGLFFFWIPFLGVIIGITALILGIKGQKDKNGNNASNKGLGVAGIVLGSITILLGLIVTLSVLANI